MKIETYKLFAVIGGVILGIGMGVSFGVSTESIWGGIAFSLGLSVMWATIFYNATTKSGEGDNTA